MSSHVICITGMHRSGTSALAGMFDQAGVFMGPIVRTPSPYSPKGHRENRLIATINDDALRISGGTWRAPVPCLDDPHIISERQLIIAGMESLAFPKSKRHFRHISWGFKCCRILWSLAGWLKLIPHLKLVGIYRHPSEVAASLMKRDKMSEHEALDLWVKYNERLLYWHDKLGGFPLINFSSVDFEKQVWDTLYALGLDNTPPIMNFYDPGLRAVGASPVPPHVEAIYEKLQEAQAIAGGVNAGI